MGGPKGRRCIPEAEEAEAQEALRLRKKPKRVTALRLERQRELRAKEVDSFGLYASKSRFSMVLSDLVQELELLKQRLYELQGQDAVAEPPEEARNTARVDGRRLS